MKYPDNLYLPNLSKLLDIQDGNWGQDWDLIMANSDWVEKLLNYYEYENLNNDEKNILMQLIIASYDDKLDQDKYDTEEEKKLAFFLERDIANLTDIFEYWARLHEPESEGWTVTPLLRKIWFENKDKT